MASNKIVYQTLEDRGTDLDKLETEGPYPCRWENSWLGDGFYFWDTFISNAHWWGKEIRNYTKGYIICKAICDYSDTNCFDLVGNTEHLEMFKNTYDLMKKEGLINEKTTVKRLIHYLKDDLKKFNYDAIRVYGIRSKNYNSRFNFTLNFENEKPSYLDFNPAIQICFYRKNSLNLRNYKIVYPDEYIDGYLV
ncbi:MULTISPECIES: hypothetical protein [Empedobacter]|uniref:hypothetical protein n=1 Tax=Empedobacter TaxID=59734 RepID=UPI002575E61C|nr:MULTISPECIES: hypothetical protein [Empedobacter]MDM1043136.1 hypothetical protein [Empedobacter brevis]MDM1137064.1 hypothetical protein [Empedobacter sp. R750]